MLHALGIVGAVLVLVAFWLTTRGRLPSTGRTYAALNAAGGLLLVVYTAALGAWASVAVNVVFAAVGFHAWWRARHA